MVVEGWWVRRFVRASEWGLRVCEMDWCGRWRREEKGEMMVLVALKVRWIGTCMAL